MAVDIEGAKACFELDVMFYMFVLRFVGGREQLDLLEVTRIMYVNKVCARKWRDKVARRIAHADQYFGTDIVFDAERKLDQLYKRLIGEA